MRLDVLSAVLSGPHVSQVPVAHLDMPKLQRSVALLTAMPTLRPGNTYCRMISFNAAISACETSGHWQRVAPLLHRSASAQPSQLARRVGSGSMWPNCCTAGACRPARSTSAPSQLASGSIWSQRSIDAQQRPVRHLALLHKNLETGMIANVISFSAAISA